jgi:hypothetical protein
MNTSEALGGQTLHRIVASNIPYRKPNFRASALSLHMPLYLFAIVLLLHILPFFFAALLICAFSCSARSSLETMAAQKAETAERENGER